MGNKRGISVELDQWQLLLLLGFCGVQMLDNVNLGYYDPVLASTTVALISDLASQPEVKIAERIQL